MNNSQECHCMLLCSSNFHCHSHPCDHQFYYIDSPFTISYKKRYNTGINLCLPNMKLQKIPFKTSSLTSLRFHHLLCFNFSAPPTCQSLRLLNSFWFHLQLHWFSPLLFIKDPAYKLTWSACWPVFSTGAFLLGETALALCQVCFLSAKTAFPSHLMGSFCQLLPKSPGIYH